MGFPVEAPQPHNHAQVPPGAPQEPSVQVSVWQEAITWILNSNAHFIPVNTFFFFFYLRPCFSSAPPAAASREGGAERNPSWTHGPQIHLWQPGAALPASSKRSSKSHCVCVCVWPYPHFAVCNKVLIEGESFIGYKMTPMFPFSANKKETWWRSQTFGIPVWQAERAVGKNWLHALKVIILLQIVW